MNDFATDEFLNKNIRVRPISGVSKAHDEGKTNDPYSKSMIDPYGKQGDDDEKFNANKLLEMVEDRQDIKRAKEERKRKKELEEAKLKKKR